MQIIDRREFPGRHGVEDYRIAGCLNAFQDVGAGNIDVRVRAGGARGKHDFDGAGALQRQGIDG